MSKTGQATLVAALMLSGQAVWADVTPEEVWQSWQDQATAQGQTVTADSTAMDGDTLTVKGITTTFGTDAGAGKMTIDEMQFQDNGDGSVAVVFPDSFPVHLTLPPPKDATDGKPSDITLNVTMPGAAINVSGVPLSLNYDTSAPSVQIAATGEGGDGTKIDATATLTDVAGKYLVEAGESGQNAAQSYSAKSVELTAKGAGTAPDGATDVKVSLNDVAGSVDMTGIPATGMTEFETALKSGMTLDLTLTYGVGSVGVTGTDKGAPMKVLADLGGGGLTLTMNAGTFDYVSTAKSLGLNIVGTDSTSGMAFTLEAALADLTSKMNMTGGDWTNTTDFGAALKAGLKMTGGFGLGATSVNFDGTDPKGPTKLKLAVGGASSNFAFDDRSMAIDIGTQAVTATIASPEIPVPEVTTDLGELAFKIALPVAKSDIPEPFAFLAKIVDLKVPDIAWSMIDPAGKLPHDAASLIVDTKGTMTMTQDLMGDAAAMSNGQSPGLLGSLDITQVLARVAGAEVTAAGGFTFDKTDMTTMPGMPYPTGKVDIKAVGVNTLADKLVEMGLLPSDQVMQGRMMISMFAKTSDTADEITSTLEFKDKGFYANGARLQ